MAARKEECLNLKSEWAGSKLPGLAVTRPNGTSRKAVQEEGDKRLREEPMEVEEIDATIKKSSREGQEKEGSEKEVRGRRQCRVEK